VFAATATARPGKIKRANLFISSELLESSGDYQVAVLLDEEWMANESRGVTSPIRVNHG
jgi:hypothetical protein